METLAYLHAVLAYEESLSVEFIPIQSNESLFNFSHWKKFSIRAWLYLLPFAVVFSAVGTANKADAAPRCRRVLTVGTQGCSVYRVQKRLKKLGYFPYIPTGYYGYRTARSVADFQSNKGLYIDGIFGLQTRRALWQRLCYRYGNCNYRVRPVYYRYYRSRRCYSRCYRQVVYYRPCYRGTYCRQ